MKKFQRIYWAYEDWYEEINLDDSKTALNGLTIGVWDLSM